ncbi:MAG: alpha/beta hydrolase [Nitrospirae bacterium]|nr:alpha/beta hydrolase [Nitrospirota bacterium]
MNNALIKLRDGRDIGFRHYGKPHGKPVFFFHGIPGSRFQHPPDIDLLKTADIRLITLERPGYGLSTDMPGRTLNDWPQDVLDVAQVLDIERFAIIGISGGGPYALACAHAYPQRLSAIALVSSLGDISGNPMDVNLTAGCAFSAAKYAPWLVRGALSLMGPMLSFYVEGILENFLLSLPKADKEVLNRPDIRSMMMADLSESIRGGANGYAQDIEILSQPWGFSPKDIKVPVLLWHGLEDSIVPPQMARDLIKTFPNCQGHMIDNGGHFIVFNHTKEILKSLMQ